MRQEVITNKETHEHPVIYASLQQLKTISLRLVKSQSEWIKVESQK